MSRLRVISLVLFLMVALSFACSERSRQGQDDQTRQLLRRFFNVKNNSTATPEGIWLADKDSVAQMVEKKYLAEYRAKPDEMQATEIRERMKDMAILFRIEGATIVMFTSVADSVGFSAGEILKSGKQSAGIQSYSATMRGKSGPIDARVRHLVSAAGESLEYFEGGFTIKAVREQRSAAELVEHFVQRTRKATRLPQY